MIGMASKNIELKNKINKAYYHRHIKSLRIKQKIRSRKEWENLEFRKEKLRKAKKFRIEHPEQAMLFRVRSMAKWRNLEFNLTIEDIVIPKFCPVFGIQLKTGLGTHTKASPSIDRIDNSKGYVKGNVW